MGLCKCPKKKVTNQFCFEHRVNVCEHCMVKKHPKCVVQSYLQWLQDSDYDPNCTLCQHDLSEENCVRLVCYHVFHWVCLDRHLGNLPPDTAPAGYSCPICQECVFPPENLVSPVAENLKKLLSDVNWARAGLGMPLLEERVEKRPAFKSVPTGPRPNPEGDSTPAATDGKATDAVIQFDDSAVGGVTSPASQHRGSSKTYSTSPLLAKEADDDKYRRRTPWKTLSRWLRSNLGPTWLRTKRLGKPPRIIIGLVGLLVGFLTLMAILSHLTRDSRDDTYDPMLDPKNNPNIRVGHGGA